jgi:hypothetical protein
MVLEFNSVTNQTYYIQYDGDLIHWRTVYLPVTAVGSRAQWIDDGSDGT